MPRFTEEDDALLDELITKDIGNRHDDVCMPEAGLFGTSRKVVILEREAPVLRNPHFRSVVFEH